MKLPRILKWLYNGKKSESNKPVATNTGKLTKLPIVTDSGKVIKSFVGVGDVIEILLWGEKEIYKVEDIEVKMNGLSLPTDFVILVKFSYNNGESGIECTSDHFKYVRHISHSC